jgi:hypothetical protein
MGDGERGAEREVKREKRRERNRETGYREWLHEKWTGMERT